MKLAARCLAGLAVQALLASAHAAGFGAYPLSDSLVSLWINTKVEGVDRPIILVYFHGAEGWHKRKWETKAEGTLNEGKDSFQELISGDLVLRARVEAGLETAEVQGHAFSLRESNVFLVLDADKGVTSSSVHALGLFDLAAVTGDPLSARALQRYPELMKKVIVLTMPEATSGGGSGPMRIHGLVSGTWGWETKGLTCAENPHTLVVSDDLTRATLRYAKGVDGDPPLEVVYAIVGEGRGYLRMRKEVETERGKDGSPVLWDWVLLAADKYCWHRTDWREGACTEPIVRCSSKK